MTRSPTQAERPVQISVSNRQRGVPIDAASLEEFGRRALRVCFEKGISRKITAEEVTVVIISDRRMAELHQRFMNIAGPTDVITFQHGEIFISVETARRNARRFRNSLAEELQLYLVHGLLHLHGLDDRTAAGSREMNVLQNSIVRKVRSAKSRARGV